MKDLNDRTTVDLFAPAKRRRGRPHTGQAMTNAERQKAYRQRLKAIRVTVTKNQPDEIDWQARAVELQLELDGLREHYRQLIEIDARRVREMNELRESVRPLKAQATK
jgi:hypothetical protein